LKAAWLPCVRDVRPHSDQVTVLVMMCMEHCCHVCKQARLGKKLVASHGMTANTAVASSCETYLIRRIQPLGHFCKLLSLFQIAGSKGTSSESQALLSSIPIGFIRHVRHALPERHNAYHELVFSCMFHSPTVRCGAVSARQNSYPLRGKLPDLVQNQARISKLHQRICRIPECQKP